MDSQEPLLPADGPRRVVATIVAPSVDGGRVPAKRTLGDRVHVAVDLVCDGHDLVAGLVRARAPGATAWRELPLVGRGNDRHEVELELDRIGRWELRAEGWVDAFATWLASLDRRTAVDEVAELELAVGVELLRTIIPRAAADAAMLQRAIASLADPKRTPIERARTILADAALAAAVHEHPDRSQASHSAVHTLVVEPALAGFAAWYELFPRSTGANGAHGTLRTTEGWLPYVRELGFDVLYLPPVHPIGRAHRKGRNNATTAEPGEPGSPWAIGGPEGGHTAVHPELGTLDDFDHLVAAAAEHGLAVALDIAFQASPDHPWVTEHPGWFLHRPDGSIQYAENPPKKYQDVYPFDFECQDWRALWAALKDVFEFWIGHGVTIFRVDNPHTKPIAFWRWCLESITTRHPHVTFLAEAFTRPKLKYALAKAGFSQGYTYFTWRSTKAELERYLTELTTTEVAEFFRPSFWPNTPDILPEDLQFGGRAAFIARLVLAATLSSHYGIYGPAFELMDASARPGSGEYLDSEKYEIKQWEITRTDSLRRVITAINRIRHEHPALHSNDSLRFHPTDNEKLICYSKTHGEDAVLVVVNLDPHHRQSGWVELDGAVLELATDRPFQVHDLLGGGRYLWHGPRNYVELDPAAMPAQIFAIRRRVRSERDFDYYL
jgi:starch synthase (maltosyl-transferring)